jgi:hypothetical protein
MLAALYNVQSVILNLNNQPIRFDQPRSAISCNLFHTSIEIFGARDPFFYL